MTTSVAPVELRLLPSRLYTVLLVLITLASGISLAVSGLPISGQVLLMLSAIVMAAMAWQKQSRWTHAVIRLHRDGAAEWSQGDAAESIHGCLTDHWHTGPLVSLVLSVEQGPSVRVAVWRDQVDADAWRRLLILLRHDRRGGGVLG